MLQPSDPEPPPEGEDANPTLTEALFARLCGYGVASEVAAGEILFKVGDTGSDMIVLATASAEVVREATADAAAQIIVRHGPHEFLGEMALLTGQAIYLTGRVTKPGRIFRIGQPAFRHLMSTDGELSDIVLTALQARRRLMQGSAARTIEIIGNDPSAASMALRTYASRMDLPHLWVDAADPAGVALMRVAGLGVADLPAVLLQGETLRRASPGVLAQKVGHAYRALADEDVDLVVVGGGPAGLAAAVYGASEGLKTVLLDAVAPGGQAAASARIENYLGFPNGLSGADLTSRAAVQALKFGARLYAPCEVAHLEVGGPLLRLRLADGATIDTRAVIVASGARYRKLPLDRWAEFEGAGIHYAATELEVRDCAGQPATVVGGANSAGQAALYLASRGSQVALVVRGPELRAGMSAYLVDRLVEDPMVSIFTSTEVTALAGAGRLDGVTLTNRSSGALTQLRSMGLFCFIGAAPATEWLEGVAVDDAGFILTDVEIPAAAIGPAWLAARRKPLPFETSVPGVFAAGDVRLGSMKRVAAAVGEGASAVASVHRAVAGVRP